ncbi:MAG: type I-G CRISPR-associated protein Csb2 [Georgenia sp.]
MSFAIVAHFPLGAYRGHVGTGEQDPWPSPLRLHSALLSAAGQGSYAVEDGGALRPSEPSMSALAWLEATPPDGLVLPTLTRRNPATNSAYRDMGLLKPKRRGTKVSAKRDNESVALGEEIMWVWAQDPPRPVREALGDLCPDVPYLGQSDSPVRLRVESTDAEYTHMHDPDARLGTSRATDVDLDAPTPGRTEALISAHHERSNAKPPSTAQDRAKTDEDDNRPGTVAAGARRRRYVKVRSTARGAAPWSAAWVLPIVDADPIPLDRRVAWAVALHRALISVHGDDAPAILTGHYHEGVPLPANRVAIHVIDDHPAMRYRLDGQQAFVVSLPTGADPGSVQAVDDAVRVLDIVRGPGGRVHRLRADGRRLIDAAAFWTPPEQGLTRCWVSHPAVHEARPPRRGQWSLTDATTLSIALTWRDALGTAETSGLGRDARFLALSDAAREHGVEVYDVRRLTTSHVDRYVHKVSSGHLVQPYITTVHLGDLAPAGVLAAIGQSRHLGGGLLTPVDVAAPVLDVWRHR